MDACLKIDEVEALVAGELSAEKKARFEAHVASCSRCRKVVSAFEQDRVLAQSIQQAYEKITVSDSNTAVGFGTGEGPSIANSIEGYEILHEIHRGGQGVVYKAVQLATKRTVALKVLLHGPYASAKQQHRFEREIDVIASLQHPNIVTVYDSGLSSESPGSRSLATSSVVVRRRVDVTAKQKRRKPLIKKDLRLELPE
ncbi:MAG: zf-HC2 domain-containing protein [Phycisphaerales bacterium]|nr:MAG: zf-HC2 domain-containing protein [Phycisphaerales bacterium]